MKPSLGGGQVAGRTRVLCLHEGESGRSVDPVFIRNTLEDLVSSWARPWNGQNTLRTQAKGSRSSLIAELPKEIKSLRGLGSSLTILVWADVDDKMPDCDTLKRQFESRCKADGVTKEEFDAVIFVFAKDRLENWIEYLIEGKTDESIEGLKVGKYSKDTQRAKEAAQKLAKACKFNEPLVNCPPSLEWSCRNWHALTDEWR